MPNVPHLLHPGPPWQPRGVWATEEISRICADLDLVQSVDSLQDAAPSDDTLYLRLTSPRLTEADLYQLAESLAESHRCYCLVNTVNMVRDAQRLQSLLAEG